MLLFVCDYGHGEKASNKKNSRCYYLNMFGNGMGEKLHVFVSLFEKNKGEKSFNQVLSIWLWVCFKIIFKKINMQMIFSKAMFDLEVGWIHFHKTKPTNSKRMVGYGDCLSH
jgi:hypothetical protein